MPRAAVHSYATELNPVEPMLTNGMEVNLRREAPEDADDRRARVTAALGDLARDPSRRRSFFTTTPFVVPRVTA